MKYILISPFFWLCTIVLILAIFLINTTTPNAGYLVLGALLSIVTNVSVEHLKKAREKKDLARVLYTELAERVARCCFDYESPWATISSGRQNTVDTQRLRKFKPFKPTIYESSAKQLATVLDNPLCVIHFYFRLDAWDREIDNLSDNTQPTLPISRTAEIVLNRRLKATLEPGLKALQELRTQIPDSDTIEAQSIAAYDDSRKVNPPAGTLLERLATAIRS